LVHFQGWENLRGLIKLTVLIDSWGWLEFFEGSSAGNKIKDYINSDQHLFISVINLAEVYKRLLRIRNVKDADKSINLMLTRCFIIPVQPEIALNAAAINHKNKIGLGDSLILASARAHNLKLVTGDPHFKKIKDVIYLGKNYLNK